MTEEPIFHEALSKRTPQERAAYLEQACADQPELRAGVVALLAAHEATGHFLVSPINSHNLINSDLEIQTQPETNLQPAQTRTGVLIAGRYTLQERIGEGGMGEVWVAKQSEPVKRKVALKLIKPGMDSRAVLARFEQERQALAIMDHPNIARVLDAGMTEAGRPFFVMELVNGLALNKFCDEARLTPKDRLELFIPICQAVQHAHQKGIVHRDLKPANILVTIIDGKPVPKVIDFGVAKATGGKIIDESMSTQFGAMVGTIEYMSPEQAGYSGEDIDTRADIYSLGVILYELMTGLRPIDSKRLKQAAVTEMFRILREEEPSKPSTRLSTNESLPSLSALRQTEPKKLMALLRGEIDWVVMKCLEKSRDRRYETANELARDIQRYLANELVEARPPSAGYRLTKFVRRHKGKVIAASIIGVSLLVGMIGTAWGLVEAMSAREEEARQRLVAENRQKEAEDARALALTEAARANREATTSDQVSKFLSDLFEPKDQVAKTASTLGFRIRSNDKIQARDLLERGIQRLKTDEMMKLQPLVRARLLQEVAQLSMSLGQLESARELVKEALQIRSTHLPKSHPDTLKSLHLLAQLEFLAGEFQPCVDRHREVVALLREGYPESLELAKTECSLAICLALYDRTESIQLAKHAHGVFRKLMGNLDIETITVGWLVAFLIIDKDPVESLSMVLEIKQSLERTGSLPKLAELLRLAMSLFDVAGTPNELKLCRQLVTMLSETYGDHHFLTMRVKTRLANVLCNAVNVSKKQLNEASRIYEEIVKEGPPWERDLNRMELGHIYMRLRSDKQAIECYQEACRGLRTLPQEFKPAVLPKPLLMLAQLYQRSKDPAYHQEIEKLLTEALDEARKKRDMPKQLATACLELGKYRMASNSSIAYVELFEEAIPLLEKQYGESHLMHLQGLALYDVTLRKLGRTSEADQVRKKLERHESLYASATRGTGSTIRQLLNGEITFWQISK